MSHSIRKWRERPTANPDGLISTWAQAGSRRFHVRVSGSPPADGAPMVLVHGMISSRYFIPTAQLLVRRHRLFVPDLPGFGSSPTSKSALTISGLTDALATCMTASGLDSALVVGHSVGTQVAVDLADRYPNLVERLVLVAPTFDPEARTIRQQYGRWLRNAIREPRSLNRLLAREALDLGVVRPIRVIRSALRDRMEDKLPGITLPVLVVRGELDPIGNKSWTEQVAALLPGARLVVLSGAPHTLPYSRPRELARVLDAYAHEPQQIDDQHR
ncbi:MAG: alpha/beta fold hydrolase [Acidimicrobiia bacterium]